MRTEAHPDRKEGPKVADICVTRGRPFEPQASTEARLREQKLRQRDEARQARREAMRAKGRAMDEAAREKKRIDREIAKAYRERYAT